MKKNENVQSTDPDFLTLYAMAAKEQGMSYGQLQAKHYIGKMKNGRHVKGKDALIITNNIADDGSRFNVEDFNNLLDTNKMIPICIEDLTLAVQNRSSIKVIYSVMQGNNEIYNRTYDKGANSVTVNGEYYGTYEAVVQGKNTTE